MTKKALLIGINYEGTRSALRGCINDVNNVREFLIKNRGFTASNITVLTDKTTVKPTRNNILDVLTTFVFTAQPGDDLHFHYSGHGSYTADKSGDEDDGRDEALVPLDYQRAGLIGDDLLYEIVTRYLPADVHLNVVLDCCHSGSGLDLRYNTSVDLTYLGQGSPSTYNHDDWDESFHIYKNRKYRSSKGRIIMISGCEDAQTSADAWEENRYQGALTYCWLLAQRNGPLPLRHLLKDLRALLTIHGYSQRPRLSSDHSPDLDLVI